LCIIKLGEKEVERKLLEVERRLEKKEMASISDDKEVERCPFPPHSQTYTHARMSAAIGMSFCV